MSTVSLYEAKTHLSELLNRASKGEQITITKHGVPVALLVSPKQGMRKKDLSVVIQGIREFRSQHALGGISLRELIDEGRKY